MEIFYLYRKIDESGVSGTGFVAEGVRFASGKIALSWLGNVTSCTVYDDMEAVNRIHGHNGKTIIAWENYDYIDENDRLIVTDFTSYYVADTNEYLGVPKRNENEKKIGEYLKIRRENEEQEKYEEIMKSIASKEE